jgi:hypothetical protein
MFLISTDCIFSFSNVRNPHRNDVYIYLLAVVRGRVAELTQSPSPISFVQSVQELHYYILFVHFFVYLPCHAV